MPVITKARPHTNRVNGKMELEKSKGLFHKFMIVRRIYPCKTE